CSPRPTRSLRPRPRTGRRGRGPARRGGRALRRRIWWTRTCSCCGWACLRRASEPRRRVEGGWPWVARGAGWVARGAVLGAWLLVVLFVVRLVVTVLV